MIADISSSLVSMTQWHFLVSYLWTDFGYTFVLALKIRTIATK